MLVVRQLLHELLCSTPHITDTVEAVPVMNLATAAGDRCGRRQNRDGTAINDSEGARSPWQTSESPTTRAWTRRTYASLNRRPA